MRVLDLFSGIGGFSLGLERAGMTTVGFCEIDPWCRRVLRKHWPEVPIHDDIKTFDATPHRGSVDLVCGGYPCQPFSCTGKRGGTEDDRHIWPQMFRIIREIRPTWIIGENVAGHISLGLDQVLSDLEGDGYAWRTFVIPAVGVDAPHRRDRVWVVGNSKCQRENRIQARGRQGVDGDLLEAQGRQQGEHRAGGSSEDVPDSKGIRPQKYRGSIRAKAELSKSFSPRWWSAEPDVGRVAHGIPRRVDRIKGLGNAVVPQVVEAIGRCIIEVNRC